MSKVRWGFISTATIGHRNWQAVKLSGNGLIAGVGSRSLDAADAYIDQCQSWCPFEQRPVAFESYEALIASDQVDAVYVPLPTGLRKQHVIAAANAGKHVLCEKPCAASADDLTEMIDACRANNVQFMDGVMYMHTNRLSQLRERIDDGSSVGDVKRITCQFSFCGDDQWLDTNIRLDRALEPHGCLGDLGWYCIRFILWTMNWKMPDRITANMLTERHRDGSPGPVPVEFSAELFFSGNVSASFYCSFITHHQQWAIVSGTKGYIQVNDFVLPYQGDEALFEVSNADFVIEGCDFAMLNHRRTESTPESGNSTANSQETNLFRKFSELAISGSPDYHWAEISLKTQTVLDDCLQKAR
ncbi:MAG: Gfo/Idh/MocA family oxidoreductase [Pirellulales bacterium]|nr:Gfo/Idh/MocA family oxidoreductase [Pirellulales bacterium]